MQMSVILKLEGLDVKAGPEDIRTFFENLCIPDGGVCILGGSLREAFIAFASEKDGQLAMRRSGNFLKSSQVTLRISSMAELEQKLLHKLKKKPSIIQPRSPPEEKPQPPPHEKRRPRSDGKPSPPPREKRRPPSDGKSSPPPQKKPRPPSDEIPQPTSDKKLPPPPDENPPPLNAEMLDANSAFVLGICTVLQSLQSCQQENKDPAPHANYSQPEDTVAVSPPQQAVGSKPGYVRLFGLPASVTKDDISHFFKGLEVLEAIVNVNLGLRPACLVKFTHSQDAFKALRYNDQFLGTFRVEVRGACEKMWTSVLVECEKGCKARDPRLKQSPSKKSTNHKQIVTNKRSDDCLSTQSQKKPRSASSTTFPEYIVMVSNLPKDLTKTDIKQFFNCPNIAHSKVLHLLDKDRQRTDIAFLIFDKTEDYEYAVNLKGSHVGSNVIDVSSVTRKNMNAMLAQNNLRPQKKNGKAKPQGRAPGSAAHTCLFVRNMPADVQKSHIKQIFSRYVVEEDNIFLLQDSSGNSAGEAVVQFKSNKLAKLAFKLHGQTYMGSKLLLTPINRMQIKDVLKRNI